MTVKKNHLNKVSTRLCLVFMLTFIGIPEAFSQTDKQQILATRKASNEALKLCDNKRVLSYLTEDVLTTTGNGTLLASKESLADYILNARESKMYWIRTPDTIKINKVKELAWENGTWKGYNPDQGDKPILGGKYAAMWIKVENRWLIKSQLFVSLE